MSSPCSPCSPSSPPSPPSTISNKSSSPFANSISQAPLNSKEIGNLKSSMNALKESYLRNKIVKDYGTLSDELHRLRRENEELKFENNELQETVDYLNNEKQIIEEERQETGSLEEEHLNKAMEKIKTLESENIDLLAKLKEKEDQLNQISNQLEEEKSHAEQKIEEQEQDLKKLRELITQVRAYLEIDDEHSFKNPRFLDLYYELRSIDVQNKLH